ncbi:winged helix-turn-helix transcriptional regulator [Streptomyces durhamensis]|nr:helix-turn-helix domain-containing protein [Streptomyces durhamensis]
MLTQTLRALERDGLVHRRVCPTVPPRVDYGLTELGVEAGRLTSAIGAWSVGHAQLVLAARQALDDQAAKASEPVR